MVCSWGMVCGPYGLALALLVAACSSPAPASKPATPAPTSSPPSAAAAAPRAEAAASATPAPRTLSYSLVQGVHAFSWPILAAVEQGYYARQGLTLDLSYANSISEQTQIVASGSTDLGHTTPNPLIPAVERGANIAAVAGLVNLNTYSFVVAPGLNDYGDLRGKQIVVSGPSTFDALMSYRLLARAGLQRDTDYTVLTLAAPPARFAALRTGQAAAALLPQPTDLQAESEGMRRIGFVPDAIELTFSVLAVRRDWAEANRDATVRFLVALRDGARWLYAPENRAAATRLLAQYGSLAPEVADGTYEIMVARFAALTREGEIDRQRFANWFELLAETGDLAAPDPSIDKYVDERYWREAMQR